ncbi:hypothetical protein BKA62DRAFT_278891 [Auriculariales sp. MPI-PUGE-AT-0066]|nr:hypothetical protein BKA62DRAFT_278891 [Auriculariales sp. MPI-PUGE-AT-0066]
MSASGPSIQPSELAGTATPELKQTVINTLWYWGEGGPRYYSSQIGARIKPIRYDVALGSEDKKKVDAELECEIEVGDGMVNGFNTLHGACSAFLVDVCPSCCLIPIVRDHVTLTLDIVCHAAASYGTLLKVVAKTTSVGSRVLALRCEIRDQKTDKLYVSGTHIKVASNVKMPRHSRESDSARL